ncbi:MAG TPA: DUF6804 family protein [Pseudolysinimonas sp.]|jgi:hypothetical protein|nr:DUF6804 family protein [Pseudolysinimonas sp.]
MSGTRDRYGRPAFRRTALAPGLLAGVALLGAVALIENPAFLVFRFVISILALIVLVFAFQAKHWWWIPVMLAVAVIWNPVYPLPIDGPWWVGAQYVAILVFVLAGVFIKVPFTSEDSRR